MNIQKKLLFVSALSILATQSFAYNIFNNTNHSIQVKDKSGLGGINVTMPAGGAASCNPKAHGCRGKISFGVYSTQEKNKLLCTWDGTIDKGNGNYFVITPGTNPNHKQACRLEYYRD